MPQLTIPLGLVSYEMNGQSFEIKLGETKLINNPTKISSDRVTIIGQQRKVGQPIHLQLTQKSFQDLGGHGNQSHQANKPYTLCSVHSKITWSIESRIFSSYFEPRAPT